MFSENELPSIIEEHQYDLLMEAIRGVGGVISETPELTWILNSAGWPRGIFRTKLKAEDADKKIAQVIAEIQSGAIPNFWMTGPASEPEHLAELLESHSFKRPFEAIGMALKYSDLCSDMPVPDGFTIRQVQDDALFTQWARAVTLWLFGMPEENVAHVRSVLGNLWSAGRLACFVGLMDKTAVASSALYVTNNVPGIYHVAVAPEHRRRGIGSCITLASVFEGEKCGCPYAILQASATGISVYRKIGFREYCRLGRFVYHPRE